MNFHQKLEKLRAMKEDDISNQVLGSLLAKMGFLEPRFRGGPSEFGKDLICYTVDQFKEKEYIAIQENFQIPLILHLADFLL